MHVARINLQTMALPTISAYYARFAGQHGAVALARAFCSASSLETGRKGESPALRDCVGARG